MCDPLMLQSWTRCLCQWHMPPVEQGLLNVWWPLPSVGGQGLCGRSPFLLQWDSRLAELLPSPLSIIPA